jgi:hypothetical protein
LESADPIAPVALGRFDRAPNVDGLRRLFRRVAEAEHEIDRLPFANAESCDWVADIEFERHV